MAHLGHDEMLIKTDLVDAHAGFGNLTIDVLEVAHLDARGCTTFVLPIQSVVWITRADPSPWRQTCNRRLVAHLDARGYTTVHDGAHPETDELLLLCFGSLERIHPPEVGTFWKIPSLCLAHIRFASVWHKGICKPHLSPARLARPDQDQTS